MTKMFAHKFCQSLHAPKKGLCPIEKSQVPYEPACCWDLCLQGQTAVSRLPHIMKTIILVGRTNEWPQYKEKNMAL